LISAIEDPDDWFVLDAYDCEAVEITLRRTVGAWDAYGDPEPYAIEVHQGEWLAEYANLETADNPAEITLYTYLEIPTLHIHVHSAEGSGNYILEVLPSQGW